MSEPTPEPAIAAAPPGPQLEELPLQGDPVTFEELTAIPLFRGMPRGKFNLNPHAVVRRHLKKGEILCVEGDFGSSASTS
jgi:hypothetical protein